VGGGYAETGLSDIALDWMVQRAGECDLTFRPALPASQPDPMGVLHDSRTGLYRFMPPLHRPIGLLNPASEYAASTALERREQDPSYRPPGLEAYLQTDPQIMPVG